MRWTRRVPDDDYSERWTCGEWTPRDGYPMIVAFSRADLVWEWAASCGGLSEMVGGSCKSKSEAMRAAECAVGASTTVGGGQ